ncbi:MAG TPA: signal peptidase I [Candidatus Faecousia faecavium]|nr:signal peptidase I [Candidatus Faecousia faecavium]
MASNAEKRNTKERKLNWKQLIVLYLHDWLFLLIAIFLLFLLLFRVIVVSGDSMYATLWDGDYLLLLSNTFYHEPKQGDVVVISKESFDDGKPIIKRVIATEGQTVDIDFDQGIVYVDGQALREDYTHNLTTREEGMHFPLVVEDDCIFVLGDNRGVSLDSRSPEIGQIDKREVLGKAIFLMLPGTNHNEQLRDFDRVGVIQ